MFNLIFSTVLFWLLFTAIGGYGQPAERVMLVPKSAADCMGAIKIVDQIGPIKNAIGIGSFVDLSNRYGDYPFLMPHEFNPIWFKFSVEEEGQLEVVIKSINTADDYNFALYLSPGPWFCNTFQNEQMASPVRANRSNADSGTGLTGINSEGQEEQAPIDANSAFCKSLLVNRGDSFYLYVDSETRPQNGYTVEIKVKAKVSE